MVEKKEKHPFIFCATKAVQAAGVVLREEPCHTMHHLKLIKVMYIAEREALRKSGHMITGDSALGTNRGMILTNTLSLIRGVHIDVTLWDKHIAQERYNVILRSSPGVDKLSEFQITLLRQATKDHLQNDEANMTEIMKGFGEWTGYSAIIPVRSILVAVGVNDVSIDHMIEEAMSQAKMTRFFNKMEKKA